MDLANLSLCQQLLSQGRQLFLVGRDFDSDLMSDPRVSATRVNRPFGSILLGEYALSLTGRHVAEAVKRRWPDAHVVINGGNCQSTGINWVHSVHSAWPKVDGHAPLAFRAKNALSKRKAIRDERRALGSAKLIIANSVRTKHDLMTLGVPETFIRVVYLGSSPEWQTATSQVRREARHRYGIPESDKVIAFIGALGFDRNKGFDTLLRAFRESGLRNCYLLAAGGGRGFQFWKSEVQRLDLGTRVRLLGFTHDIGGVLAASDLLVSPVRYEAYGLNVHEAICRGVPSIVTASAGMAELYTPALRRYLLTDPNDYVALSQALSAWYGRSEEAKADFEDLGVVLRNRSWQDMSREFISAVEDPTTLSPEDACAASQVALV